MLIKVIDINEKRIVFQSPHGTGTGIWKGEEPRIDEIVDVELEINDLLTWGESIWSVVSDSNSIGFENSYVEITATVESFEQDGCVVLRLGNSVIMVEVQNPPNELQGLVCVLCQNLYVYPTGI